MEKEQKKINKYTSRSQMVEDIITWNDFYGPATKEAAYKERFAEIHARLLRSDGAKFPLAAFIQKHKLAAVEVFLLLRVSALDTLRLVAIALYKITTLLQDAQIIGTRTEAMRILLDRQSALFTEDILGVARGCIELKHNFLSAPAPARKKTVKKRTLNPLRVLKELNKYVIGQEAAKKQLVAGVFEHLAKCARAKKGETFTKSNIFISGPTGCGKTYLCQCLAKILNIPFVHADASQYTQAGYSGLNVSDILTPLLSQCKEKGKLPVAMVFVDEIDKLRANTERWGVSSTNVQMEFLRLLEAKTVFLEQRFLGRTTAEVDISQVLFVAGGAFENLLVRHDAGKDIGFTKAPAVYGKTLTADDYIQAGMVPELMGRFTYLVQLSGLEKDELRRILLNPYHGPFQQYKDLLKSQQELLPELVEQMVNAAYERRLGARGLQQQVGRLFQEQFLQQSVQIEL